jgi:hypothetical protein
MGAIFDTISLDLEFPKDDSFYACFVRNFHHAISDILLTSFWQIRRMEMDLCSLDLSLQWKFSNQFAMLLISEVILPFPRRYSNDSYPMYHNPF